MWLTLKLIKPTDLPGYLTSGNYVMHNYSTQFLFTIFTLFKQIWISWQIFWLEPEGVPLGGGSIEFIDPLVGRVPLAQYFKCWWAGCIRCLCKPGSLFWCSLRFRARPSHLDWRWRQTVMSWSGRGEWLTTEGCYRCESKNRDAVTQPFGSRSKLILSSSTVVSMLVTHIHTHTYTHIHTQVLATARGICTDTAAPAAVEIAV